MSDHVSAPRSGPAVSPPRFRIAEVEDGVLDATPPRFNRFLTLGENIESVFRYREMSGRGGRERVKRLLADLSDPAVRGDPELLAWRSARAGTDVPPHVLWRYWLAQQLAAGVAGPQRPTEVAPHLRVDFPHRQMRIGVRLTAERGELDGDASERRGAHESELERVIEHVCRFLHGWSRTEGMVELRIDKTGIRERFSDDEAGDNTAARFVTAVGMGRGRWGWAWWLLRKEFRRRPTWLAGDKCFAAAAAGFVGWSVSTGGWRLPPSMVVVLAVTVVVLVWRLWSDGPDRTASAYESLNDIERAFDLRPWVRVRAVVATIQTAVIAAAGAAVAALLDTPLDPAVDWRVTCAVICLTASATFLGAFRASPGTAIVRPTYRQ